MLTVLHHHLPVVVSHIIFSHVTFLTSLLQQSLLFRVVQDVGLAAVLLLDLLGLGKRTLLDVRNNQFCRKVNDLRCNGKVVHLVSDARRVDLKAVRRQRHLVKGNGKRRLAPEVQDGHEDLSKWNVDESREEQWHV